MGIQQGRVAAGEHGGRGEHVARELDGVLGAEVLGAVVKLAQLTVEGCVGGPVGREAVDDRLPVLGQLALQVEAGLVLLQGGDGHRAVGGAAEECAGGGGRVVLGLLRDPFQPIRDAADGAAQRLVEDPTQLAQLPILQTPQLLVKLLEQLQGPVRHSDGHSAPAGRRGGRTSSRS